MPLPFILTGNTVSSTYPRLVQVVSSSLYDGLGNPLTVSASIAFDGNRDITRGEFAGLNVGGSDVVTFLDNLFFPFSPATVSDYGGGLYEIGTVQNPSIYSSISVNNETIFGTGSIFKNSSLWNTQASIPPYSFTFNDSGITTNTTYQTFVQTNNDGSPTIISSNTTTVSFVYPYLWGMNVTSGLSGTSLYNAFTPQIITQPSSQIVNLVGTATYIYFAYPSSYPDLTSILDPNGFQIITDFTKTIVSVTSTGLTNNWTTNYKVYQTNIIASPSGNYYTFTY